MCSERWVGALALLVLALPAASSPAPGPDPAAIEALPARGDPLQCLMLRTASQSIPVGKQLVLVQMGPKSWFRNRLQSPCPSMSPNRILAYRAPPGGLICRGDALDVVDPVSRIRFGPCILGDFVPIDDSWAAGDQPAP